MSKPITGKTTTSVWKQKRKNGDIYVWERKTVYIPETRKTKELSRKLLGKIPAGSTDGEIVPTRPKRKKTEDAEPQSSTRSRVGSTSLLRWVGEQSGITDDLLSCMDEGSAKKVDTIAQFWLANQGDSKSLQKPFSICMAPQDPVSGIPENRIRIGTAS